jgi:hypothetical protein
MTRPATATESSAPDEVIARIRKLFAMAGAIERIEQRLRLQRYAEMGQSLGTRSLMLATDRENDDYIARRFFVRTGPEREQRVDLTAFQAGWRRADEVSLSHRAALPSASGRRRG